MKKSLLLAALLSLCLVSCGNNDNSSNTSNNNNATLDANLQKYYKDVIELKDAELNKGLHDLINKGRFTSYGELKTAFYDSDVTTDENGETKFVDFYTHNMLPTAIDWNNNWNREHVWPKSLGVEGTDAYSDLNHIRPCNPKLNSFRGNCIFGNVESGTEMNGCKKSGNIFEPVDTSKGDSARIVVYVAVAHNIDIRRVMHGNDEEIKQTLLDWNEIDPVDQVEINRNNAAYDIQSNRNPFIDYEPFFNECVEYLL